MCVILFTNKTLIPYWQSISSELKTQNAVTQFFKVTKAMAFH